ncbi:MAG: hypothetical protein M3011_11525 [Actinomycetota bacterium]|nr:hypothetical protein [Actinomycetota bacterium]
MAPDRDDSDAAQVVDVQDGTGSSADPVVDATTTAPEDLGSAGAEGGDVDAEGPAGATVTDTANAANAPVPAAEGGGSDTEGTVAEAWRPAERATTGGPDAGTPDTGTQDTGTQDIGTPESGTPESGTPESGVADPGEPDTGSVDTGVPADGEAPGSGAWPGDLTQPDDLTGHAAPTDDAGALVATTDVVAASGDVAPNATADPDTVGFDGRPRPDDGGAYVNEVADGADPAIPPRPAEESVEPRRRTRAVVVLTVLSLVVVGAGVGGLIWSRGRSKASTRPPTAQAPSPSPTLSDDAFVTYTDRETGFSMRYPRGWTRSEAPVREVRLLVSDGKQFSALVRVIHTEAPTTAANLTNVKAVTDGLVGPGAQILKQDPITVNGLIGFRYIYTLTDKDSGLTTAHLHYFLFQGHKMNSIVFEALPSETFSRIEGVFDQMLASFHSDPEPP